MNLRQPRYVLRCGRIGNLEHEIIPQCAFLAYGLPIWDGGRQTQYLARLRHQRPLLWGSALICVQVQP